MITTLTGATQSYCRSGTVRIHKATGNTATIDVLVMHYFSLLLSTNATEVLSGLRITQSGSVKFEKTWPVCSTRYINKTDFGAKFNEQQQRVWVTAWKWSAGHASEKHGNMDL